MTNVMVWRSDDFYPDPLCGLFELFVIMCYIVSLDKHDSLKTHGSQRVLISISRSHLIASIQSSRSSALAALSL